VTVPPVTAPTPPADPTGTGVLPNWGAPAWQDDFNGTALTRRWTFDSNSSTNGPNWTGKGNHQLSIADVDGDGRQEVMFGSMAVDDNGRGLWQNNTHHGDAYHVGDFIPSRAGLEVMKPSETTSEPAMWVGDARTGQIIWSSPSCGCDNGRGVTGAHLYGDEATTTYSNLNSFYLLVDRPSVYGLPDKPFNPWLHMWGDYARALVGAMVPLAALVAIILVLGR